MSKSDFVVFVLGEFVHIVRGLEHILALHIIIMILYEGLKDIEQELTVEVKEEYGEQCCIGNCTHAKCSFNKLFHILCSSLLPSHVVVELEE